MDDLVASPSDASIESVFPTDAETARFPQHGVPSATEGECEPA